MSKDDNVNWIDQLIDEIDSLRICKKLLGCGTCGATEFKKKLFLAIKNNSQEELDFDETKLEELTNIIYRHGVLSPMLVRELGLNKYEVINRLFGELNSSKFIKTHPILDRRDTHGLILAFLYESFEKTFISNIFKKFPELNNKFLQIQEAENEILARKAHRDVMYRRNMEDIQRRKYELRILKMELNDQKNQRSLLNRMAFDSALASFMLLPDAERFKKIKNYKHSFPVVNEIGFPINLLPVSEIIRFEKRATLNIKEKNNLFCQIPKNSNYHLNAFRNKIRKEIMTSNLEMSKYENINKQRLADYNNFISEQSKEDQTFRNNFNKRIFMLTAVDGPIVLNLLIALYFYLTEPVYILGQLVLILAIYIAVKVFNKDSD